MSEEFPEKPLGRGQVCQETEIQTGGDGRIRGNVGKTGKARPLHVGNIHGYIPDVPTPVLFLFVWV